MKSTTGWPSSWPGHSCSSRSSSTSRTARPARRREAFQSGVTLLRQAHFEARRLIAGVRPPILDESGVVEAIAHLVNEQSQLKGRRSSSTARSVSTAWPDPGECRLSHRARGTHQRLPAQQERQRAGRPRAAGRSRADRDSRLGDRLRRQAGAENRFGLEGIRQRARMLGGKCLVSQLTRQRHADCRRAARGDEGVEGVVSRCCEAYSWQLLWWIRQPVHQDGDGDESGHRADESTKNQPETKRV